MNQDWGLAVVIVAVLLFYLRLIVVQRQRALRITQSRRSGGKRRSTDTTSDQAPYSILSRSPLDLAIAGSGMLAIVLGALLYAGWIALPAVQPYWWLPTALGIVAFSWAFKL